MQFMEREAKLRRAARESKTSDEQAHEQEVEHGHSHAVDHTEHADHKQAPPSPLSDETVASESKPVKAPSKPMWAMTAEEAEVCTKNSMTERTCPLLLTRYACALPQLAAQAKEDEELDDLLSFAKELNFDKYIDDLEVHAMMEQVRKRIKQLEAGVAQEKRDTQALLLGTLEEGRSVLARNPTKVAAAEEQPHKAEPQQPTSDNDDMISVAKVRPAFALRVLESDGSILTVCICLGLCQSVLSESGQSVRNIHSTRSISQIALKTKEKLMAPDENDRPDNVQLGEGVRKYEEVG
jgi:hypothetical protein